MLSIVIGVTVGVVLAAFAPKILTTMRARIRGVYRDRHGVLHTHLDGVPIRIGVVPDPGEVWQPYTTEEAQDDLDQVCLN